MWRVDGTHNEEAQAIDVVTHLNTSRPLGRKITYGSMNVYRTEYRARNKQQFCSTSNLPSGRRQIMFMMRLAF